MYEAGLIAVATAVVLIFKLPGSLIRRILWLDVAIDIVVTIGFTFMLAGTYSGMMTALVAGLAFSIVLAIAKAFIGYEKLTVDGWQRVEPRIKW